MKYKTIVLFICIQVTLFKPAFSKDDLFSRIENEKRVSCNISCDQLVEQLTKANFDYAYRKIAATILRDHVNIAEDNDKSDAPGYAYFNDPVIQKFADCDTTRRASYLDSGDGGFKRLAQCIAVDNFDEIYKQQASTFVKVLLERWDVISSERYGAPDDEKLLSYIDSSIEAIRILQTPDKYKPAKSRYKFDPIPQITMFLIRRMEIKLDVKLVNQYLRAMKDIRRRVKRSLMIEKETQGIHFQYDFDANTENDFEEIRETTAKYFFDKYVNRASKYYHRKAFYEIYALKYDDDFDKVTYGPDRLGAFLYNYPISKTNIAQYNNLAFYLQQSNDHISAIKILKKVIEVAPERTVAYINLADSFSILKDIKNARKYYSHYFFHMTKLGLVDKIPKRLLTKYSDLYEVISEATKVFHKKPRVVISQIVEGDLNKDNKTDFVFFVDLDESKTGFIYLSELQGYRKVLQSNNVLGENNTENLNEIYVRKNNLFFNYEYHHSEESYQFLLRNDSFILAGLEAQDHSANGSFTTSVNFLNQTKITESSKYTYEKGGSEEVTKKDKTKIKSKDAIKLQNFNKLFEEIQRKVF